MHMKFIQKNNSISSNSNLLAWEQFLQNWYKFDGIQFNSSDPYYDFKNNYINIHIRYAQPYGEAYAFTQHIGIFRHILIVRSLNFNIKEIDWGFPHEIGHMMDIPERTISETSNNMISKYYYYVLLGNINEYIRNAMLFKIEYLTKDSIDNKLRGCDQSNQNDYKGFLVNKPLNYYIWWDLECYLHGYWGKLDNMYRYNYTETSGLTILERMVYFSSIILKLDLGYYFTRWGLSFDDGKSIFDEAYATSKYNKLMNKAADDGLISKNIKKKFWYYDNDQYNYKKTEEGCYVNKTKYNVQILKVIKKGESEYFLKFPTFTCFHLGYEVYEINTLIGFTFNNNYTDKTVYNNGYTPKYKIIGYDRLLQTSKASDYKSYSNTNALKSMNLRGILSE